MGMLDIIVLVVYFASMAAMGPIFSWRSKTTEGYFLGDRSFPGWLIGFSMFAASISSITFMAYPADAYKTAWLRMLPNFMLPVAVLMASRMFLPFFRRGRITSAYEYLEGRFGPNVRLYAASAFIVGQVIRISLILFLVSQLVETVTGLSSTYSVLIGGIITSFYTVTGGIQAVIWTDFIQAIVLWVGGLLCVAMVALRLGGPIDGLVEVVRVGIADSKFQFADVIKGVPQTVHWGFDLTEKTVLLMLLVGLGDWIYEYSGNQNVIQRYCASKNAKEARRAMWLCCWFSVPTWALFMFLGTCLYAFYKAHPAADPTAMLTGAGGVKPEGILPYFVIHELPAGLSGLVIAAVLAAAMSSISSSMNAVSAVSVVDIYRRRMAPGRDDTHYVFVAKAVGVAQAVIMIGGAIILVWVKSNTLQDTARVLGALTAGGVAGLYLLGFLTRVGDGRAVLVAIAATLAWTAWMALSKFAWWPEVLRSPIDSYYAGLLGHGIMFGVGYVLGLMLPKRKRDLHNFTVWTQDKAPLD
jgi:SSS family solute:Na+ symporter